nr:hypothetical protein [Tanacetum cinerariifolium]
MQNPRDISNLTTTLDMALEFMSKAFQLNNTTPTNNNQRSSSNPCYSQIAQSGYLVGQNAVQNQGIQNVGNQNRLSVVPRVANQHGNGNVVAARAEGNSNTQLLIAKKDEAVIQLNSKEFDFIANACAYDEIKKVTANCNLQDNLQHESTSGTQSDKALVYDSDGSAEANVSNIANQKKHKAQVWKPKNAGSKERLASPKPSTPRSCLSWSPTGRTFNLKGKIIATSESVRQSDCSKGDNACTSNPQELISRRFPNSTFSMIGGQNWFDTLLIPLLIEYKPIDKEDHGDNECDT